MKRKVFSVLAALGLTSPVFASGMLPPPEPMYFDGLYLGAGVGVQHTVSDVHNDIADNFLTTEIVRILPYGQIVGVESSTDSIANHLSGDLGKTSLAGGVFAGLGKTFNSVYAGLELFAHYANINPTLENELVFTSTNTSPATVNQVDATAALKTATSVELSSNWSYGGAFRLGFLASPKTMFYILLGVEATEFDVDVNHKLALLDPDELISSYSYAYGYSFDETKWGFMPGVGIETMLTSKLSLRAQYTYVSYGEINHDNIFIATPKSRTIEIAIPEEGIFLEGTQTFSAASVADDSIKPHRGLFTLDLTYHFNGV